MMIKAVMFDLDDTVYDYQSCDAAAVKKLRQHSIDNFSLCAEEFDYFYEKAKGIVKGRLYNTGASHNRLLYFQTFLELISQKPAVHALELYDVYWNKMLEDMELYDYVLPLFGKLSQQEIRIAVLTDLTAHIQHRKIKRLGIAEYIDVLVTSEEAGKEKPDKKMFTLAMEKLNLFPEQIIMIGDSFQKDVKGAEAVGIHSILYNQKNAGSILCRCMELIRDEAERI